MDKIYTIVAKDGKELYATFDISNLNENEIAVEELRTQVMENPYFDFENKIFYDKIDE